VSRRIARKKLDTIDTPAPIEGWHEILSAAKAEIEKLKLRISHFEQAERIAELKIQAREPFPEEYRAASTQT
jgi:hypothetical protein